MPAFSWQGKTPQKTNNFFPVIGERLDNDEGKEEDNVKTLQDMPTFVMGPSITFSLHLNHGLKVSSREDFSRHWRRFRGGEGEFEKQFYSGFPCKV